MPVAYGCKIVNTEVVRLAIDTLRTHVTMQIDKSVMENNFLLRGYRKIGWVVGEILH